MSSLRIAFVYTSGRKSRLQKIRDGVHIPQEFFLGATELMARGYDVEIFELDDFTQGASRVNSIISGVSNYVFNATCLNSSAHLLDMKKVKALRRYTHVVACNEYVALGLLPFYKLCVLRNRLIFYVMGMLAKIEVAEKNKKNHSLFFLSRFVYDQLIKKSHHAFFLGEGELTYANRLFPKRIDKMSLLPFSVDTQFWECRSSRSGGYVLFVGNDARRDYDLLLSIAQGMPERKFYFITRQITTTDVPDNVVLINGDWKKSLLSDEEIRKYYCEATVVILPLKESLQPSGQSVCLQSIACATPVIMTRTSGFWNNKDFFDGENILFITGNNLEDWKDRINSLYTDPNLGELISANAKTLINANYNLDCFCDAILDFF